jgi:hypothetical protein
MAAAHPRRRSRWSSHALIVPPRETHRWVRLPCGALPTPRSSVRLLRGKVALNFIALIVAERTGIARPQRRRSRKPFEQIVDRGDLLVEAEPECSGCAKCPVADRLPFVQRTGVQHDRSDRARRRGSPGEISLILNVRTSAGCSGRSASLTGRDLHDRSAGCAGDCAGASPRRHRGQYPFRASSGAHILRYAHSPRRRRP